MHFARREIAALLVLGVGVGVTARAPAQTVEEIAASYLAALGVSAVLGPEAGTEDHYGYSMPDGRVYAVRSKSRSWWSQTKYASGLVGLEAASKVLPLSFDEKLTYVDPETGEEKIFLLVLDSNPDVILQQINKVQEALDFQAKVRERRRADFPMQQEMEHINAKLAAARGKNQAMEATLALIDDGSEGQSDAPPRELAERLRLYREACSADALKDNHSATEAEVLGRLAQARGETEGATLTARAQPPAPVTRPEGAQPAGVPLEATPDTTQPRAPPPGVTPLPAPEVVDTSELDALLSAVRHRDAMWRQVEGWFTAQIEELQAIAAGTGREEAPR